MESLKVHNRSRVEGHLQILQILLILLVWLDLAEETLLGFLELLLGLFEPLKGRILKSFRLKLFWFFKRTISNSCCQNVDVLFRTLQENGFYSLLVEFHELEAKNSNCGAFSQANLMKLFNVIENLIDSQIDGERTFEVAIYSFVVFGRS